MSNTAALDNANEQIHALSWPLARYCFDWTVTTPIKFPEYAGSAIRGAFGKALRKTACMTHLPECKSCPLFHSCPYTAIFETPAPLEHTLQKFTQIPAPYVIEAPEWGRHEYLLGETLSFNIVLMGQAQYHFALIIFALQRAFQFDVSHGTAQLDCVKICLPNGDKSVIFSKELKQIQNHSQTFSLAKPLDKHSDCTIEFLTPLRLQENGRGLSPQRINAQNFIMTLARRLSLVMEFHTGQNLNLPFQEMKQYLTEVEIEKDLHWQDWVRYSSRQHQKMHLGGVVGHLTFFNLHPLFINLLSIAQWTHVGKNASFGLGRFQIEGEKPLMLEG